jgi:uncharacterized surface protein with fasciclin (FAS1) repeats
VREVLSQCANARVAAVATAVVLILSGPIRAQMFEPVKPWSIYDALTQITAQTMEDRARRLARAETDAARSAAARFGSTFRVLLDAIDSSGLVDLLDGVMASDVRQLDGGETDVPVPYTLFAPTDQAFEALPEGKLSSLFEAGNKDELTAMVKAHLVPGLWLRSGAKGGVSNLVTLNGGVIRVSTLQEQVRLSLNGVSSAVTAADITTGIADERGRVSDNGAVHLIDRVLAYTFPSPSKEM